MKYRGSINPSGSNHSSTKLNYKSVSPHTAARSFLEIVLNLGGDLKF